MIVRHMAPVDMPSGTDHTIHNPPALGPVEPGVAAFGVTLKLPDVSLTVHQKRSEDGTWAFIVSSSAEDTVERFGPEGSRAPRA